MVPARLSGVFTCTGGGGGGKAGWAGAGQMPTSGLRNDERNGASVALLAEAAPGVASGVAPGVAAGVVSSSRSLGDRPVLAAPS